MTGFVLILCLIVLNGAFSMAETAVVSARRVRLLQRAEAGDERARQALALVRQPDRFLSTTQLGITLIGILSGAFGGASLSEPIAHEMIALGMAAPTAHVLAFTLVVATITYLSLVIGELVPKTFALRHAEGLATRVAGPMLLLSRIASPLVWVLTASTNGLLRLFRVPPAKEQPVTEDEINLLLQQGVKVGAFAEEEQQIVGRVFRTADRRVNSLMTPRRDILYLDDEDPWEENLRKIAETPHAAFPVCSGGLDDIHGIVTLKRLWCDQVRRGADNASGRGDAAPDLQRLSVKPTYVAESTRALAMLETFRRSEADTGHHLALVVDEYGNVVGLVTLHDVVEGIVGDLPSGAGAGGEELSAVRREDGSWLVDGMLPVSEMVHLLDLRAMPEDAAEYSTLGGFLMNRLGHIPVSGEQVVWEWWRFEVADMDGHRVDKVLATPAQRAEPPDGAAAGAATPADAAALGTR